MRDRALFFLVILGTTIATLILAALVIGWFYYKGYWS
jgi:hypothetical protein